MKILTLPIKKQWFDMIKKGIKLEEYREIKPFYEGRLFTTITVNAGTVTSSQHRNYHHYDVIHFTNGYGNHRPQLIVECKGISEGLGKVEWGAPLDNVVIIKLG